ncbi:glycosyltransferase family 2 protein [Labrys monachus]|uniref:Glycosyltransferase involved in cell wall biosynthesis n=1 Tax=Labrys monachus TaxID=217067 RepID=A0ABU0FGL2_9HYPH|nr:glycosyltransferase family 2 protein [Labrys monachus]MDQ0393243.1 glycosyltransferase involved in cell wall biosynthesis [Labrys monachus]
MASTRPEPTIAILIPCCNEAVTVERVVADFRKHLPLAAIHVYDNNSTDGTATLAAAAGALVRHERRQGKGHVVRRMFADIEADIYLIVDGDATYDAASAPALVATLRQGPFDLVNGARIGSHIAAYRPGHRFGNWLLTALVTKIFGAASRDMLSGYKAMSRRFVKSFPALSTGFEIETELLVHALDLSLPIAEIDTPYKERPAGSRSKLRTVRDGMRILRLVTRLVKEERPFLFFSLLAAILVVLSLAIATPVVVDFIHTGLVPRLPSAVLATGLMLSAIIAFFSGMILDTVTRGRQELKRLHYLSHAPVW